MVQSVFKKSSKRENEGKNKFDGYNTDDSINSEISDKLDPMTNLAANLINDIKGM